MRRTIVFLEQQSWLGGAQRVLEATLNSIGPDYERIVALPERGPFRSALEERNIETMEMAIGNYRPGRKSVLEMAGFLWRSVYCGLKLAAFIRRRRVALIYVNGPRCLPAGVLAMWLTRRPAIFHLHLILTRKLETILVTQLARHVSRIVACSEAAAASLLARDPRLLAKTQILYNPLVRRDAQSSPSPHIPGRGRSDRFTIGIVGRITETKGHHLLLRALAQLPLELRGRILLVIVGSEAPDCPSDLQYRQQLRADSLREGLEHQIVWTGYLPDPSPWYSSMDILVQPSTDEALGITVLEALDRGIPVIASRTGGIPEIVRDGVNGLLVAPGDVLALRHALEFFLQDSNLRMRLVGGAGLGVDRRFSIDTYSSKIRVLIGQTCPLPSPAEP
jgi:glycosyltransferase involved in cell wall biosynthesis